MQVLGRRLAADSPGRSDIVYESLFVGAKVLYNLPLHNLLFLLGWGCHLFLLVLLLLESLNIFFEFLPALLPPTSWDSFLVLKLLELLLLELGRLEVVGLHSEAGELWV